MVARHLRCQDDFAGSISTLGWFIPMLWLKDVPSVDVPRARMGWHHPPSQRHFASHIRLLYHCARIAALWAETPGKSFFLSEENNEWWPVVCEIIKIFTIISKLSIDVKRNTSKLQPGQNFNRRTKYVKTSTELKLQYARIWVSTGSEIRQNFNQVRNRCSHFRISSIMGRL